MCKEILEDKNIKLEMMNNLNIPNVTPVPGPVVTNVSGQVAHVTNVPNVPNVPLLPGPDTNSDPSPPPQDRLALPEQLLEMYNMLIGITSELERIKLELAKSMLNLIPKVLKARIKEKFL